jgi:ubiquinone/menaquinone biosynthesis C-methylase UbiE
MPAGKKKEQGDFWDGISARKKVTFMHAIQQRHEQNIERLLEKELPLKRATILDAGCGEGRFAAFFLKKGAKVVGIDSSRASIATARKQVKGAQFIVGSVTKMPFKDSSFDVVFLSLVLQHVLGEKDFRKAVHELVRVTKPGGKVCLLEIVSAVEKKRGGYIALRSVDQYRAALSPQRMRRHLGVRFPYFSHAAMFALKKVLVRKQVGDVRDTYTLYDAIEKSKASPFYIGTLRIAHAVSYPLTKLSRVLPGLSPERVMIFTVEK